MKYKPGDEYQLRIENSDCVVMSKVMTLGEQIDFQERRRAITGTSDLDIINQYLELICEKLTTIDGVEATPDEFRSRMDASQVSVAVSALEYNLMTLEEKKS